MRPATVGTGDQGDEDAAKGTDDLQERMLKHLGEPEKEKPLTCRCQAARKSQDPIIGSILPGRKIAEKVLVEVVLTVEKRRRVESRTRVNADPVDGVGFFRVARDAAEKSLNPEHRIGAVVCNKKPIGIGWNQWEKTNPRVEVQGPGRSKRLHAEMHACQGLSSNELEGASLYVVRLTPGGKVGLAKPCQGCVRFLQEKGIKKVYYTTDDGYAMMRM